MKSVKILKKNRSPKRFKSVLRVTEGRAPVSHSIVNFSDNANETRVFFLLS